MKILLSLMVVALLAGCAEPAKVSGMTTENFAAGIITKNPQLQGSTTVGTIAGGQETDPLWTSEVDAPSFKAALEQSLLTNALLAPSPAQARYRVEANLAELDQPFAGFTLTVGSTVQYRVYDGVEAAPFFQQDVRANGVASAGDALSAVDRLRIANERSIQVNIQKFIELFIEAAKDRPAPTS